MAAATAERVGLNRKEQQLEALITPAVESQGCTVWGVEYLAQGRHSKLRIYIDKAEGVAVEDCERVSREVSDLLDLEDTLPESYTLEVSSPGMDRTLFKAEQYAGAVGERVDVRLSFPFEGRKRFVGLLAGVEDDCAVVRIDEEEYLLPLESVQKAQVLPDFVAITRAAKQAEKAKKRDR